MWLSEKMSAQRSALQESAGADIGMTTIGGACACVAARGELRDLEVFAPGGIVWQPSAGDTVLVIRGGSGAQEQCVAAASTAGHAPEQMSPGELYLYGPGGNSVYLKADGSVAVTGNTAVRGDLSVAGNVAFTGTVSVTGQLIINGRTCPDCGPQEV